MGGELTKEFRFFFHDQYNWEVKETTPTKYGAKDAGGKHMWIDLAALRNKKGEFLSLFFQYAEQELVK